MSLFGFLGKPTKKADTSVEKDAIMAKALQGIDEQIDLLTKKEEVLQRRVLDLTKKAKAAKKKEQALPHLRMRKRIMQQIDLVNGQVDNLTSQRFAVENAKTMAETIRTMKAGNDAVKQQGLDVDKMADDIDEMTEEMQKLQDVEELMSRPMFGTVMDDDDLLAEFEQEELELAEEEEEGAEEVEFPEVPAEDLVEPRAAKIKEDTEAKELEDLAMW
eukprot:m.79484 g.79484  ORF g.79484 m.79484 type:complete len:217 (-) comp14158_c0_seq1:467-1117(-)